MRSERNIWEGIMKLIKIALALSLIAVCLAGCDMGTSQSSPTTSNDNTTTYNYNKTYRKVTVYNTRTDTILFAAEGYMTVRVGGNLIMKIRTGESEYKKVEIALNEWTVPVVEEIDCEHDEPYYYKIRYKLHYLEGGK
jgi:hypothetical protein